MPLSRRFVLPLPITIGLVAYSVRPLVDQLTLRWFVRELDIRAMLIANAVQEQLAELVSSEGRVKITARFNRIAEDERLYAIGYCDATRAPAWERYVAVNRASAATVIPDLDRVTMPAGDQRDRMHIMRAGPRVQRVPMGRSDAAGRCDHASPRAHRGAQRRGAVTPAPRGRVARAL